MVDCLHRQITKEVASDEGIEIEIEIEIETEIETETETETKEPYTTRDF
jgi:hypothetical protein